MNRLLVACLILLAHVAVHAADAAKGQSLFVFCSTCHGEQGQGMQFDTLSIPAIAGLPDWYVEAQLIKFQDGRRGAHAKDTKGLMMRPMSRTLRTEEDVKDVAAHISSLPKKADAKTIDGDLAKGKFYYDASCASCHGPNFEGNADPTISAPSQKALDDWYMLEQLNKFKDGIRGTHPKDQEGARMLPIIQAILPQLAESQQSTAEDAMKDVVAYIYSKRD